MNLPKLREEARRKLFYARSDLRRRLENQTVPVESQDDRWIKEIRERERREAISHYQEKADAEAKIAEARRHELTVARSWGRAAAEANSIVDTEVLNAIGDTLSKILTRLEKLERTVDALQNSSTDVGKRLNVLSEKEKSFDERRGRQVATLERKLETQKDLVRDLATEIRLLKAQANKPQPEPSPIHHVIHNDR
jgi:chromosome segregation ATPase